jgi:glycosyltransferase involved in cell wall biosynthesis
MNTLLLTYFFPPYNSIGCIRVGKFARYLSELGHTVNVVTAQAQVVEQQDASLPVELDPAQVVYTRWLDVNAGVRHAAALVQRRSAGKRNATPSSTVLASLDGMPPVLRTLSKLYLSLVNIPDAFWGWQPYAQRASLHIARHKRPDIILASGPPFSAFQVAAGLARRLRIPWVADFRDFWADKPQYPFLDWRRNLDRVLERRALRHATGLVTVSAPMLEVLRRRYPSLAHEVITNGFDPQDFLADTHPDTRLPVILRYTGTLFYVGNNNPTPLLQALHMLGENRKHVRLEFLLRDFAPRLVRMAADAGVSDTVHVLPPVSYQRSLELQQRSDALVLILPSGQNWEGAYSGKFFEYCGAGRPILAVADSSNVAAQAVKTHSLGLASTNPYEICKWLEMLIDEKLTRGRVAGLDPRRLGIFTRQAQTEKLAAFLSACVTSSRR